MKKLALAVIAIFLLTFSIAQAALVNVNTVYDTVANTLQQVPNAVTAAFRASFFTATSTVATSTFPIASSTTICLGSDCRTAWPAGGGGGTVYLASSSPFTVGNLAFVTTPGAVGSVATGTLTENATGLSLSGTPAVVGGSSVLTIDAGFTLASTTGLTNLYSFYDTPSTRITANDGLTWSGNNLNFDGGNAPGGELGGTWASPTIDDGLAVTNWNLTTPTLTTFFGTPCTGNQFLQDISDTGAFTCATAAGTVYLASTTPWTVGNAAYVASNGALGSVATGTLTDSITGLSFSNQTRGLFGGTADLALDAGYSIPLTNSLLTANSSTTGNLAFWSGNQTIGNVATGTLTEGVSGLEFSATRSLVGGAAILNLTTGFVIPTSSLWTSVADFYQTPSTRITAGANCSWAGNTFNCEGGGGGGGGGGSLSTTTDTVGDGANQAVSYVTGDVMFGGSASTSAEFQFDDDGAKLIISSSSAQATTTIANVNNASSIQLGVASNTDLAAPLTRGLHFSFQSLTQAVVRAAGTITDWVFALPVQFASTLKDGTGSAGSNGSVLLSTGTGVVWTATSSLGISGGGLSFAVGPTSTPIWRSTMQGWTFPDGSLVNTDIQANRFHTIKPIWYEVDAAGADLGTLDQRTVAGYGTYGYSASNTQIIKENSVEQFVTVSGNDPEIHTLTASSTLVTSTIAELIAFATSTGFTGIELDWEGFGSWTAGETTNYISYVTQLSNEAHKYGLKTMIYLPPIWNSVSNGESGSGDEWDSANSDGYYELEYEDFENVPVDYILIAVYDYQFDYSAGRPNSPLKWQDDIISYAKRKISDHDRLIIGIPGAGYGGATGGYAFTAYTYASSTLIAGFSGATRDTESAELTWTNGGNSYFACDDTCINTKRERAEREGINRVSIWHIGGNRYGSGKAEPTIHEPPATVITDQKVYGEQSGFIARFYSYLGTLVVSITDTLVSIFGNLYVSGTGYFATSTYYGATTSDAVFVGGTINTGEWVEEFCTTPTAEITQVIADTLRGCNRFAYLEDAAGAIDFVRPTTGSSTYFRIRPGAVGTVNAAGDGMAIGWADGLDMGDLQKVKPRMEFALKQDNRANATSTFVYAGITDKVSVSVDSATEPGVGFYVYATSSLNWLFACNPASGNTTYYDTGIATSTFSTGNANPWTHFRIEVGGTVNTAVTGLLKARTQNNQSFSQVGACSIDLSASTAAAAPIVSIGKSTVGQSPELHVSWIKFWYYSELY